MSRKNTQKRFYVKDYILPVEEDAQNEFKGHRNLAVEEIPDWCWIPGTNRRSRKPISRNINAFLNTGKGGIIYIGVIDEGKVKGIPLCDYQKDHIHVSMKDLMSRYTPQVPENKYKIEIIPIVQKEDLWKDNALTVNKSPSSKVDPERLKPHLLRTSKYCWCDALAAEGYSKGILSKEYVIEITIYPFTEPPLTYEDGSYQINLHPVYQDEEGNSYFRRQASIVQYNISEIVDLTIHEIQGLFLGMMEDLKKEANMIKEEFQEHMGLKKKDSSRTII